MIRLTFTVLGLIVCVAAQNASSRAAPEYNLTGVVNAASFEPRFASGMLVSLSGKNLAWTERWRTESDLRGSTLPTRLPETWTTVTVAGIPAAIEYAAPEQVLFLLPPGLKPGPVSLQLAVAGLLGPRLTILLEEAAPSLYRYRENEAMVRHAETMEFVAPQSPARPGEAVILYANAMGPTQPAQKPLILPRAEAQIVRRSDLRILLNGQEIEASRVGYAGIMPEFPAFYEIRLALPEEMPADPELKVCLGENCSPPGVILRTSPAPTPEPEEPAAQPE